MFKKNVLLLLVFCSFLLNGVAQESCTPHDHPANEIRSKGFMDAGYNTPQNLGQWLSIKNV